MFTDKPGELLENKATKQRRHKKGAEMFQIYCRIIEKQLFCFVSPYRFNVDPAFRSLGKQRNIYHILMNKIMDHEKSE